MVTPLAIGSIRLELGGQSSCCVCDTQLSQVAGRAGRKARGGYHSTGRCNVANTGKFGGGRYSAKSDPMHMNDIDIVRREHLLQRIAT